jgi:hypothetical protein
MLGWMCCGYDIRGVADGIEVVQSGEVVMETVDRVC